MYLQRVLYHVMDTLISGWTGLHLSYIWSGNGLGVSPRVLEGPAEVLQALAEVIHHLQEQHLHPDNKKEEVSQEEVGGGAGMLSLLGPLPPRGPQWLAWRGRSLAGGTEGRGVGGRYGRKGLGKGLGRCSWES